jgi:deoxyribonuclease IV
MIGASAITLGGLPNGFRFGQECGCESIQLYVAPSRTWKITPVTSELEIAFRQAWQQSSVQSVVAHASLLLNLASDNPEIHKKSFTHLVAEIHRALKLGITSIVIHPGSNPDKAKVKAALSNMIPQGGQLFRVCRI